MRAQVAIDGAPFEYTAEQMDAWDADGPGSTFVSVYGQEAADVCAAYGMDPARKPRTHRPDRPPVRLHTLREIRWRLRRQRRRVLGKVGC